MYHYQFIQQKNAGNWMKKRNTPSDIYTPVRNANKPIYATTPMKPPSSERKHVSYGSAPRTDSFNRSGCQLDQSKWVTSLKSVPLTRMPIKTSIIQEKVNIRTSLSLNDKGQNVSLDKPVTKRARCLTNGTLKSILDVSNVPHDGLIQNLSFEGVFEEDIVHPADIGFIEETMDSGNEEDFVSESGSNPLFKNTESCDTDSFLGSSASLFSMHSSNMLGNSLCNEAMLEDLNESENLFEEHAPATFEDTTLMSRFLKDVEESYTNNSIDVNNEFVQPNSNIHINPEQYMIKPGRLHTKCDKAMDVTGSVVYSASELSITNTSSMYSFTQDSSSVFYNSSGFFGNKQSVSNESSLYEGPMYSLSSFADVNTTAMRASDEYTLSSDLTNFSEKPLRRFAVTEAIGVSKKKSLSKKLKMVKNYFNKLSKKNLKHEKGEHFKTLAYL